MVFVKKIVALLILIILLFGCIDSKPADDSKEPVESDLTEDEQTEADSEGTNETEEEEVPETNKEISIETASGTCGNVKNISLKSGETISSEGLNITDISIGGLVDSERICISLGDLKNDTAFKEIQKGRKVQNISKTTQELTLVVACDTENYIEELINSSADAELPEFVSPKPEWLDDCTGIIGGSPHIYCMVALAKETSSHFEEDKCTGFSKFPIKNFATDNDSIELTITNLSGSTITNNSWVFERSGNIGSANITGKYSPRYLQTIEANKESTIDIRFGIITTAGEKYNLTLNLNYVDGDGLNRSDSATCQGTIPEPPKEIEIFENQDCGSLGEIAGQECFFAHYIQCLKGTANFESTITNSKTTYSIEGKDGDKCIQSVYYEDGGSYFEEYTGKTITCKVPETVWKKTSETQADKEFNIRNMILELDQSMAIRALVPSWEYECSGDLYDYLKEEEESSS